MSIAKGTQSLILNNIINEKKIMSASDAARLTGIDRSTISRALKGSTLLSANATAIIIKHAYKLSNFYEVRFFINNCKHLHLYLIKELKDLYTERKKDTDQTYRLISALTSQTSWNLYVLLYSEKTIQINTVFNLFGEKAANEAITSLEKSNIISVHRPLNIIKIESLVTSTEFSFIKNYCFNILNNIKRCDYEEGKSTLILDSFLISKKSKSDFDNLFNKFANELANLKLNAESYPLESRTELLECLLTCNNVLTIEKISNISSEVQ